MPALSPCPSPGSSLPVFAGRSMDPAPFYEGGCRAGLRHAPSSYETSHEACAGGHQQSAKLGRSLGNCSSSPWSGGEREKSSAFFGRKGDKWREAAAKIWEPEMGFPPGADCKTRARWGREQSAAGFPASLVLRDRCLAGQHPLGTSATDPDGPGDEEGLRRGRERGASPARGIWFSKPCAGKAGANEMSAWQESWQQGFLFLLGFNPAWGLTPHP